jgi:predicted aldo/keto reductase-like oxidoreductase
MKKEKGMKRRSFFKASALGLAGLATGLKAEAANQEETIKNDHPQIKRFHTLGRTGFNASDLGIGTGRASSVPLITAALDAGINYIDTAEEYGRGQSEMGIGEAFQGRDRKSLFITTKILTRDMNDKVQIIEKVNKSLERLKTDYVDCMMMQGAPDVASLKNEPFHQAMAQLKQEKKVRFLGVSSHGAMGQSQGESMEQVDCGAVEDGRFDVFLVIYNFLQREGGEKVFAAAAKKNIAITIMKSDPVGKYYEMKERVEAMKKAGEKIDERMIAQWERMEASVKEAQPFMDKYNLKTVAEVKAAARKFVLDNPNVHTLIASINSFDDLQNYLPISGSSLTSAERQKLMEYELACGRFYCRHNCGVCETSCPSKVPVNQIMRYFHYFDGNSNERYAMGKYAGIAAPKADRCRSCPGWCEKACPYNVPIQGLLNIAHSQLTLG